VRAQSFVSAQSLVTAQDRVRAQNCLPLGADLAVPSPLVGSEASEARSRGQGGGCHTARGPLFGDDIDCLLARERFHRTPSLRLPPSPALPRKGGGSELCSRLHRRQDASEQYLLPLGAELSVPSPLAGEGQGGGCHTARGPLFGDDIDCLLARERFRLPPFAGPPLSPTLPRKGGGSNKRRGLT
jgi:hypothetical protein